MELISKDLLALISFLFPGFLAAWIFYGLTSHPKPSQFERIVQALIFTLVIQLLLPILQWILIGIGNFLSIGVWSTSAENIVSAIIAVTLGLLLAFFTNNDKFHKVLRRFGFTSRTSHPSEWFFVFSNKVTYVILNLKDGRRLYGWPKEWPIEPTKGQFYIMLPSWILEDGSQLELHALDGILVNVSDVQWVEFIQIKENENVES